MPISKDDFPKAVDQALADVRRALDEAENSYERRDLQVALSALERINAELVSGHERPRHLRSAEFIRYVVDEEPSMKMAEELKERVVQLEHLYKRY